MFFSGLLVALGISAALIGLPGLSALYQYQVAQLMDECNDFELYSVVDRKPVEVTKSLTC